MIEILQNAAIGALGGVAFALTGYLKTSQGRFKKLEEFDVSKFLKTAGIGLVVGAVAGTSGMSYEHTVDYLTQIGIYGGITGLIENIVKAIVRRFHIKIRV